MVDNRKKTMHVYHSHCQKHYLVHNTENYWSLMMSKLLSWSFCQVILLSVCHVYRITVRTSSQTQWLMGLIYTYATDFIRRTTYPSFPKKRVVSLPNWGVLFVDDQEYLAMRWGCLHNLHIIKSFESGTMEEGEDLLCPISRSTWYKQD